MERGHAPQGGLGTIPPPIPGCTQAVANFSQEKPLDIPDGGVMSTSIHVSGQSGTLWDVNIQTFIWHESSYDIQMTLTSPSGTVVTLTTDNPGELGFHLGAPIPFSEVFFGTVWDDQADPDGDLPYSFNNGLVTDHGYHPELTATPLVPEDALRAFRGENPNGNWTLSIADTSGQQLVGYLYSWILEIATLQGTITTAATTTLSASPGLAINGGPHETSVVASGLGNYLLNVEVVTQLAHSWSADVDMVLASPQSTFVTLTTGNGGSNWDVFLGTTWQDNADPDGTVPYISNNGLATDHGYMDLTTATPLVPEEAFGAFRGQNPNGTWRLRIVDTFPDEDDGLLSSWQLLLTTATCNVGCTLGLTCPPTQTVVAPAGALSVPVNYPPPTVSGTCPNPVVSCVPASGSAFPVGTTVVTCTAQSGQVTANCSFNVVVSSQPLAAIPTLSFVGFLVLGAGLVGLGLWLLRKRG